MRPLEADEPAVVGPYRLLGRLGSGGMGRVYLGRSAGGRTVAVKIVHPHFALDEEFRARFRREVEAARRVGGAYTAPVLDADPDAPVPWVATGYAAGPTLTAAVTGTGPLADHSVRALGAGLAEALSAVHGLGLVHRDVKPSNVLLTLDGPLLIDFGIARATDGTTSLTATGASIGSPGYMAPEQILGRGVTGAADVFSLGAVLAYAATGASPFPGDSSAALLYKVVHEEPELGGLPGGLRDLVAGCLAKDPAARPSPAAVATALAPGGAARLVAAGWLPGPLVEQVSRSAVRLLNLEAAGTAPAPPGVAGSGAPSAGGPGGSGSSGGPGNSGNSGSSGSSGGPGGAGSPGGFGSPVEEGAAGELSGGGGPAEGRPAEGRPAGEGFSAGSPAENRSAENRPSEGGPAAEGPSAGSPPERGPSERGPSAGGPVADGPMAGAAPAGVFGPPDPSYASASPYSPCPAYPPSPPAAHDGPHPSHPSHPSAPGTHGPGAPAPEPRDAVEGRDARAGAGKVSVSVAAASVPGAGGRGRRLSCTIALAVAGALAAVTVGSVFVFDLLPGGSGDSDDGGSAARPPAASTGPSAGSSADSSASPSGGAEDGAPSAVPKSYLGTWEGDGYALDGRLPMGTVRVTVRQADEGDLLGTFRQTDLIGGTCETDLFLKEVTGEQLVATSVARRSTTSECTTGRHEVRLIPVGDDLRYETDNEEAGDPVARMAKIE